jgi:hypothetical protein
MHQTKDVKQIQKEKYHGVLKHGNEYYDEVFNQAVSALKSSTTSNNYFPEFLLS